MNDQSSQLPWEVLRGWTSAIPWDAMRLFADAAAADRSVADELFRTYDVLWQDEKSYVAFYVPAIFAMAAPGFSDLRRRDIGELLIRRLIEVEKTGDKLVADALVAAAGALGPVVLPVVLDAIEGEPDLGYEWLGMWRLAALVVQVEDAELRTRVVRTSIDLLERIDRGEAESWSGMGAAWVLALLGRTEHLALLERLRDRYDDSFEGGDYEPSVNRMRGIANAEEEEDRPWEQPVQKWLTPLWEWARDWFVEPDRQSEWDDTFSEEDWVEEMAEPPQAPEPPFTLPVPIKNVSPKVGRNEPCPCGSGRKYKKCCGRTAQDQTQNPT